MKKQNEPRLIYEVSGTFGSEFQKEAAEKSLHGVIQTWAEFYAKKHMGNKIVIEQKRVDMNLMYKRWQGEC